MDLTFGGIRWPAFKAIHWYHSNFVQYNVEEQFLPTRALAYEQLTSRMHMSFYIYSMYCSCLFVMSFFVLFLSCLTTFPDTLQRLEKSVVFRQDNCTGKSNSCLSESFRGSCRRLYLVLTFHIFTCFGPMFFLLFLLNICRPFLTYFDFFDFLSKLQKKCGPKKNVLNIFWPNVIWIFFWYIFRHNIFGLFFSKYFLTFTFFLLG